MGADALRCPVASDLLEAVRKASRFPDLTSPFPSGDSRAQRRRGAVAFSSWLGGEGQCSNPCLWRRFIRFVVSNQPSQLQESPQPRKQTSLFPLCASARALPIRSHSAFSYAPLGFSDRLLLEAVRKGSRILNLTSPSGPGKPPAEDAVTFSTNLSGWVGSMV